MAGVCPAVRVCGVGKWVQVSFATRDGNSFFTGGLDEVAIYPRMLTGVEIMENYTAGIS